MISNWASGHPSRNLEVSSREQVHVKEGKGDRISPLGHIEASIYKSGISKV